MKQKLIILITLLSVSLYVNAQEYRVAKSSGTLKLNITGVIVEGYDGNDIIFSGQKVVNEESTSDERAKGLVPISSSNYNDNTGLGINVSESGQNLNVNLIAKKPIGVLTIKVPNGVKVSILNNNLFIRLANSSNNAYYTSTDKVTDEIVLKNLKSEIEVSVQNSNIKLQNNTGPMNIKTVAGSVDAIFSGEVKGPVSIISVTNYVDVTLPASTKANLEMSSNSGKLYAAKEFKIDLDKDPIVLENITAVGFRSTNQLSGLRTITGADNATSVNGSGSIKATNGEAVDEVVVTGYPSGTTVKGVKIKANATSNKKSGSIKATNGEAVNEVVVTGYPLSTTVNDVKVFDRINYAFRSGDRIKGKLNGGGIDLIFKSTNKNVYLRQQ